MAIIVDTSVWIGLERRRRPFLDWLAEMATTETVAIAAITASELLAGVHRADTVERRLERESRVEEVLSHLPVIPFDLTVARVHARIWAELTSSGRPIGPHDALIAASALAHDYAVLTDNVREFSQVPGLQVRQPGW